MITVRACIRQVPQTSPSATPLALDYREASSETYLNAVAKAEAEVPSGWQVIYVEKIADSTADTPPSAPSART